MDVWTKFIDSIGAGVLLSSELVSRAASIAAVDIFRRIRGKGNIFSMIDVSRDQDGEGVTRIL